MKDSYVPLWARPGADPVRLSELKPKAVAPSPPPVPEPRCNHRERAVISIAEPDLGRAELRFESIVAAAIFAGVTASNLRSSMVSGYRAAGRLWWYADRPLHERPATPHSSRNTPVMVGERLFISATEAAKSLSVSIGTFGNYCRRKRLPNRFGSLPVKKLGGS